jgi:hypothetical protein
VFAFAALTLAACGGDAGGPGTLDHAGDHTHLLGAVDGRVYWARGDTLNWFDAKSGERLALDVPGAGWSGTATGLVTPGRVFVFQYDSIIWVEIGPGPHPKARQQRLTLAEHPAGFVHEGDCLYALHTNVECSPRNGAIIGVPLLEGSVCPRLDVPAKGFQPRPFAADTGYFYWANTSCAEQRTDEDFGVHAVDRATGAITDLFPNAYVSELRRGADGLYWRNHRGVFRFDLTSRRAEELFVGAAHCLLVDRGTLLVCRDDGVYWRKEGSSRDRLVPGTAGVKSIAVDTRYLYWLTPRGDVVRDRRR